MSNNKLPRQNPPIYSTAWSHVNREGKPNPCVRAAVRMMHQDDGFIPPHGMPWRWTGEFPRHKRWRDSGGLGLDHYFDQAGWDCIFKKEAEPHLRTYRLPTVGRMLREGRLPDNCLVGTRYHAFAIVNGQFVDHGDRGLRQQVCRVYVPPKPKSKNIPVLPVPEPKPQPKPCPGEQAPPRPRRYRCKLDFGHVGNIHQYRAYPVNIDGETAAYLVKLQDGKTSDSWKLGYVKSAYRWCLPRAATLEPNLCAARSAVRAMIRTAEKENYG